jgi:hypothetical protein
MRLAKPCIDVGILTNRGDEQLAFWQREAGQPLERSLGDARVGPEAFEDLALRQHAMRVLRQEPQEAQALG